MTGRWYAEIRDHREVVFIRPARGAVRGQQSQPKTRKYGAVSALSRRGNLTGGRSGGRGDRFARAPPTGRGDARALVGGRPLRRFAETTATARAREHSRRTKRHFTTDRSRLACGFAAATADREFVVRRRRVVVPCAVFVHSEFRSDGPAA